jgi:hypothetical protein
MVPSLVFFLGVSINSIKSFMEEKSLWFRIPSY